METIGKKLAGLTVRAWLCLGILAGSFLVIDGVMSYVEDGSGLVRILAGSLVCIVSILIGAIPEK